MLLLTTLVALLTIASGGMRQNSAGIIREAKCPRILVKCLIAVKMQITRGRAIRKTKNAHSSFIVFYA